jgi:hypothetical protein
MKIALFCDSLLLKKSLESYLKGHIVKEEYAEIIISDKKFSSSKPLFLINHSQNAELKVPFTKAELFWKLEEFHIKILEREIALNNTEDIKPFIQKINKKHHNKIAKLAKKII